MHGSTAATYNSLELLPVIVPVGPSQNLLQQLAGFYVRLSRSARILRIIKLDGSVCFAKRFGEHGFLRGLAAATVLRFSRIRAPSLSCRATPRVPSPLGHDITVTGDGGRRQQACVGARGRGSGPRRIGKIAPEVVLGLRIAVRAGKDGIRSVEAGTSATHGARRPETKAGFGIGIEWRQRDDGRQIRRGRRREGW